MEPEEILGSKSRLKLLRQLSRRDMYVSELMDAVGLDGKTTKYHLDRLEDANIISSRLEGRRKYYSLEREVIFQITPSPHRRYIAQFPPVDDR